MKRSMRLSCSALLLVSASLAFAEPIKRIQFPAISPDGSTILFSWQNDIWSVARTGGKATRLTVHAAIDSRPVWYPDSTRVAFASNRYGSYDIFSMRPDGTDLRRVTFDSSVEYPSAVSGDGRFIYGQTSLWSRGDLFRVASTGGDLQRLTSHPFEATFGANLSADGTKVFYNRGAYRETAWQKPTMQSSALPEIWVADNTVPLSNHKRVTSNEFTDLTPLSLSDGSTIAVSNRNGFPNIWRLGKNEKLLTEHKDGTSRNPSVSRDGHYVAYEFESDLFVLDVQTGVDALVNVEVPGDDRANRVQDITVASGVQQFAVSPDGKRTVFAARGDLFLIPEKGGTTRRLTTNLSRDYSPVWLDAKTILYTAMEGGSRRLKTVTVEGVTKDFLVETGKEIHGAQLSPDGSMVAFHKGTDEIGIISTKGEGQRTLLRGDFLDSFEATLFNWSPDSRFLAASLIKGRRTDVTLIDAKTGKQLVVAKMVNRPQRGSVSTPQFLSNGKGIFFLAPEYEEPDLFMVDLVPADITFNEDDLDKIDTPPSKDKPSVSVEVYEPNIKSRLRRLTTTGVMVATAGADGKTIYALTGNGFQSINSATGAASTLIAAGAPGSAIQGLEFTNGKLYAINGGQLGVVNVAGPASAIAPISINAQFTVDLKEEEKALFEEIWWTLDRQYYDPAMNGKNWKGIKAKFEKIVPYAYDRTDFYRMMGEMMEELDSSHLGSTAPPADYPGQGSDATGFLGADLDPQALSRDGTCVIASIVPNSPADHPQSKLMVGDRITEVDGVAVSSSSLSALLNKKLLKKVNLTINRDGKVMNILIKPSSQAIRTNLEYDAFVANQRAMVDKLSEGKLGYVHIRAMDKPSLDQFLREIRTEGEGRKGVVIDVRFNGGGSTAVDVLNTLIRSPWLIRSTRGEYGLKLSENIYRGDGLELPTALMCNTFSFSNAEVITEGFRKLKLGPIVGERTPGYVIGTGAASLWDGGQIRLPVIGAYAVNGENLENNGRRPDHVVWFDPNAWMNGRDLQTEKVVLELLKNIGK